jgi:hypothetical protein
MGGLSEKDRAPSLEDSSADDERPGHVVDNRGRSVWQWANVSSNSTSVLLKRLEHPDLALEATQRVPAVPRAATAGMPSKAVLKPDDGQKATKTDKPAEPADSARRVTDAGGGFDPYNSR